MTTRLVRGQCFTGELKLKVQDLCDPSQSNPYQIPVAALVEMKIAGESVTQTLRTDTNDINTGTAEVVITDNDQGEISFKSTVKSALFLVADGQTIVIEVTDSDSCVDIFEIQNELFVKEPDVS